MLKLLAVYIIFGISISEQISTPESTHYWAGVVEFSSEIKPVESISETVDEYVSIIQSSSADAIDIIVFPESTFKNKDAPIVVPDPREFVVPCNNFNYNIIIREISCAARDSKKYVVINLTEKTRCPDSGDYRPCASDLLNKYNTNVVFDRNGTIISKYRKVNLFGEAGINVTDTKEIMTFETDFGVKFGHFICFDILFDTPAMDLVRRGVTNFVYPTMWYSELPFLTAVQVQQNWAYANNVNLLAAGASFPEIGSTGTGIYAGKQGSLVSVMNFKPETKLYVAEVPKSSNLLVRKVNGTKPRGTPSEMDDLQLTRDEVHKYTTKLLEHQANKTEESLCHGRHCCNFQIDHNVTPIQENERAYTYRTAAYYGMRTFNGFADVNVVLCAIIACTDDTLDSCGNRFKKEDNVVESITFEAITISGTFEYNTTQFMSPNGVDTSIMPLDVSEFDFVVGDEFTVDESSFTNITYSLIVPRSNLLSFAIWGRTTSHAAALVSNVIFVLTVALLSVW